MRVRSDLKSDLINNMDHMRISGNEPLSVILRGRPFDSEGGGLALLVGTRHHVLGRKIYFRVNRGQNLYFQPQQILEKAKKKKKKKKKKQKKKKKKGGGGGGLVRGFSRGGRTWFSMFCITFCRI